MRNIAIECAASVLLAAGCVVAAHAAPPQDAATMAHNPPTQTSTSKAAFGPKVSASALAKLSGGSDVENRVTLNGSVSDTRTRNVVTGTNTIGGNAFGSAAGLPVVIQNSGNSVLIQNSVVVNLQLQQ